MDKMNFGCGDKREPGFYNVDILDNKGIHKTFDFDVFPYPLEENKFGYILVNQVMEHLMHPDRVLEELYKCCKNNAIIEIIVPFVNSKSAYCNLQHKSFFNEKSFPLSLRNSHKLKIESQEIIVQRFLRWLPRCATNFLSVFLMNIHVEIRVKIKVIKDVIKK